MLVYSVIFLLTTCRGEAARSLSRTVVTRDKAALVKKEVSRTLRRGASSLSSKDSLFQSSSTPVSVEAILFPRRFPVKMLIRLVCLGSVMLSLVNCLATAGIPHLQAIWSIMHGDSGVPMPHNYRPSLADMSIARLIASSTNEILPPIALPSVGPLLGLMFSLFLYVACTILVPRWFTAAKVFLEYTKVSSTDALVKSSTLLHKRTAPLSLLIRIDDDHWQQDLGNHDTRRKSVICPLQPSTATHQKSPQPSSLFNEETIESHFSHLSPNYFELNQCRFYFDSTSGNCIDGGPLLHSAPFRELEHLVVNGITENHEAIANERYKPYNRPSLATPTITEAFTARISSPLVVIQFLGRILSCLEEGPQIVLNLIVALVEHWMDARQAIVGARQMAQEVQTSVQDTSSLEVLVLRNCREKQHEGGTKPTKILIPLKAVDLIPGDVFVLPHHGDDLVAPVDALLLRGECLVNEAVLTGESVPQSKTPIDFTERLQENENASLDLDGDRNSVIFAGTTLIHCSDMGDQVDVGGVAFPRHNQTSGVILLALRTGTYSSKGQILRTLNSGGHVGAISTPQSEKDAVRLILSLSVFAIASCASLFVPQKGQGQTSVSGFRRFIQCTRILIASIPSDLPLALSAVARSCSRQLRQDADVICSEPGSLLTAATVNTVVFDKTGTLTADTQSVSELIPKLRGHEAEVPESVQISHLAGCHSLVHVNSSSSVTACQVIGDPLDQAGFFYSGWKYNSTNSCYEAPSRNVSIDATTPIRLWQIKSFPFDANKRVSSAVVVVEEAGGSLRLLALTKGSPETMRSRYHHWTDGNFTSAYDEQVKHFEVRGYRSIAMGWKDLSGTVHMERLFPDGLNTKRIVDARKEGSTLHRSDIEGDEMQFCGFVKFHASIRPSSRRVIDELNTAGIRSVMLTGDAIDAAITVASTVKLIQRRKVAILESVRDEKGLEQLQWNFIEISNKKGVASRRSTGTKPFTRSSLQSVLKREMEGKCAICCTGSVLDVMLASTSEEHQDFMDNLFRVSVIARATPKQKKVVISYLKRRCGRSVMMCGDGVNDVAAMRTANVAVALLNGFGAEKSQDDGIDFDDERKRKKVEAQNLGSQRRNKSNGDRKRLALKLEKVQAEIRQRVADREGLSPESIDLKFEMQDIKDMISASLGVMTEERRRQKSLQLGGGDAARILASERWKQDDNTEEEQEMTPIIKTGEASLVASFSCLHPSIDGVEAVLRGGVATAASALATQRLIALHSLMNCFNLATLYRGVVRYGTYMNSVETTLYMLLDQQRYKMSCIPRPRLPKSPLIRPPHSMFHPASILRTIVQAIVNILLMNLAVGYAKSLEVTTHTIPRKYQLQPAINNAPKLSKILTALAMTCKADDDDVEQPSLFRRPPFHPNYETNTVFILSILQNMLISLTNHQGKPFFRSLLESRQLCTISVGIIVICVALVAEISKPLNTLLQLKPLPHKKSQVIFLGIMVLNIVASSTISRMFSVKDEQRTITTRDDDDGDVDRAADLEAKLLEQEAAQNLRGSLLALSLIAYLAIEVLLKTK